MPYPRLVAFVGVRSWILDFLLWFQLMGNHKECPLDSSGIPYPPLQTR